MIKLRALSALLCIASIPIGCDSQGTQDDEAGVDLDNGQRLHDDTCMAAGCHPANGVVLSEHIPEHTDDQLIDVIEMGEGMMPAQTQLSEQDVADVIAYMRMLYG